MGAPDLGALQPVTKPAKHEQRLYQIGEVAETRRDSVVANYSGYYEEVGLVPPSGRSPGGFRLYDRTTTSNASRAVKAFKPLKFTLEQMRYLLGLLDHFDVGAGAQCGRSATSP